MARNIHGKMQNINSGYHCIVKLWNYREFFVIVVHIFVTFLYIFLTTIIKIIPFTIRKIYLKNKHRF